MCVYINIYIYINQNEKQSRGFDQHWGCRFLSLARSTLGPPHQGDCLQSIPDLMSTRPGMNNSWGSPSLRTPVSWHDIRNAQCSMYMYMYMYILCICAYVFLYVCIYYVYVFVYVCMCVCVDIMPKVGWTWRSWFVHNWNWGNLRTEAGGTLLQAGVGGTGPGNTPKTILRTSCFFARRRGNRRGRPTLPAQGQSCI